MEDTEIIKFPSENLEFQVQEEVATTHDGLIKIYKVNFQSKTCILKMISKSYLAREKQVEHIYNEKNALQT